MSKQKLYNVPPWSIIRVPGGRMGVTPNMPRGGRYNVALDGRNETGISLAGTVEVEVIKYAAQIAMEALGNMLKDEADIQEYGIAAWDMWKTADEKCECGNPITFGEFALSGRCNGCVQVRLSVDYNLYVQDATVLIFPSHAVADPVEPVKLLRLVRFRSNYFDPRPVNWPLKHPYWITGYAADESYATVRSYADDEAYILNNWPDATDLEVIEVDGYIFTDRFPKPDWFVSPE